VEGKLESETAREDGLAVGLTREEVALDVQALDVLETEDGVDLDRPSTCRACLPRERADEL
jgi:hypothetical protein